MPKKPAGPAWAELLGPSAAKDVGAALQGVLAALEAAEGPERLDAEGLLQAVASALQSSDAHRALVGSAALLAALGDEDAQALGVAGLAGDHVYSGLATALASGAPLQAAAAARSLCALTAGAAAHRGPGDDRHDRQTRSRKVAPQLRAALEAHPKSVQVQEAVAEGCCELLSCEQLPLGGFVGTLWAILWPLVVHPRDSVAEAAELCLCKLTWCAKAPQAGGGSGGGPDPQHAVPSAEEAMATACAEFGNFFRVVEASARREAGATAASRLAQRQCVRLLSVARGLLRHGQSSVQAYGRRDKGHCLDDSIVVAPVAKLAATIDGVVTAVFRDSSTAAQVLGSARGGAAGGLAEVLEEALVLAAALAETAVAALLPQAARIRRWLELLTEVPPSTHWRHCRMTCCLALALSRTAPAVLLSRPLVGRLVSFALALMQPSDQAARHRPTAASQPRAGATAASGAAPRRKRRAGEAFGAAGEGAGAGGGHAQPAFPEACRLLAWLCGQASPLLAPSQVAAVCELAARLLWLGLCAPTPDQTASAGGDTGSAKAAAMAAFCQEVCRDVPSALALLDVVEALQQRPRPGVVPLAPSLRDAFTALLGTVAAGHRRRAAASSTAVAVRAAEVRAAALAAAAAWSSQAASATSLDGAPTVVSFVWPEAPPAPAFVAVDASAPGPASAAVLPAAAAPPAAEDAAGAAAAEGQPSAAAAPAPPAEAPPPAAASAPAPPEPSPPPPAAAVAAPPPSAAVEPAISAAAPPPAAEAAVEQASPAGTSAANQVVGGAAAPAEAPAAAAAAAAAEGADASAGASLAALTSPSLLPALPELPPVAAGTEPMELFPDLGSDASPIPSLCMDSPSGDEQ